MNLRTLGTVFTAAIALAAAQAGAQQVYKCQDAAGKVTYASQPCAELGMRSAGEVKESINVAPAQKAPPRPATPPPAPAAQSAPPKAEAGRGTGAALLHREDRQGRRDPLQRQAGRNRRQ